MLRRERKKQDDGENCTVRMFKICTLQINTVRGIKSRRMRWVGHVALR
jgi:hypothetical protein